MDSPLNSGQLECLNCHKPTTSSEAKTFLSVYVCPECHGYAQHFRDTLVKQLQWLIVITDDAIREALTKGELHPSKVEGKPGQGVGRSELLQEVKKLVEGHRAT